MAAFERWVWTELLAFDNGQADCGVAEYLALLGFVPEGLSLLISSPDFILQHEGVEADAGLSPQFCSRDGHAGNENRRRQAWTKHQLRELVRGLRAAGVRVFLASFTRYMGDRFHREWLTDNPECRITWAPEGPKEALFVLTTRADGTPLHDFFAAQITRVCEDYGFDGWHGPDGYGPMSALYRADYGDDLFGQFLAAAPREVPPEIAAPAGADPEKLIRRRDWVWQCRRAEWREFYTDRWAAFWRAITTALHAIGRQTMINSPWTRDPFEGIYRYGVDYRKIAAAGVDRVMVETAAGGILLGSEDRDYHYDYLAMFLHLSACVPGMKRVFLHNTKDVVENWDLLRHAPPMLEREVYALANVFLADEEGRIRRCADGLLACLGDGLSATEWQWLGAQWQLAFEAEPKRIPGATLIWANSILDGELATYAEQRDVSSHWLTYRLLERNAPVHLVAPVAAVAKLEGPFLIPNAHHLSPAERHALLESGKPLIVIGPDFSGWPEPAWELVDTPEGRPIVCRVYHAAVELEPAPLSPEPTAPFTNDPLSLREPLKFREELPFRPVSEAFLARCAELVRSLSRAFTLTPHVAANLVTQPPVRVGVMLMEDTQGRLRLGAKNSATVYARIKLRPGNGAREVEVLSDFPVTPVDPDAEGAFSLIIPPRGIVVAEVEPIL